MNENNKVEGIAEPEGMQASAYTDPAIFDMEMERIFGRAWIFVGHESQVPKIGDFRLTRMGTDEVILVRQFDNSLYLMALVFYLYKEEEVMLHLHQ